MWKFLTFKFFVTNFLLQDRWNVSVEKFLKLKRQLFFIYFSSFSFIFSNYFQNIVMTSQEKITSSSVDNLASVSSWLLWFKVQINLTKMTHFMFSNQHMALFRLLSDDNVCPCMWTFFKIGKVSKKMKNHFNPLRVRRVAYDTCNNTTTQLRQFVLITLINISIENRNRKFIFCLTTLQCRSRDSHG